MSVSYKKLWKLLIDKDMKKKDLEKAAGISNYDAVVLMGLFTFLFLGAEYLYVDVLSRIVSEDKTVLAQNYALGVSAAGFLLYPLFNRFCKERLKTICFLFIGLLSVLGIAFIGVGTAYTAIFTTGLVLFLLLGLLGSGVFYVSMRMMKTDRYLARTVGISYALGILLQFVNNNLVRSEIAETVILSVFLLLLIWLLMKNDSAYCRQDEQNTQGSTEEKVKEDTGKIKKGDIVSILMILLALSGLAAGFIFDIKNRKYMGIVMYCIMVLSTICVAILKFAGPFMAGLIVFYLSAGFFAVFFTSGFMEISSHMRIPELWAGMGRAVNNIAAAVIANFVLTLLSSDSNLAVIILVLVLFVTVSVVAVIYTFQKKTFMEQLITNAADVVDEKERLRKFSEVFSFTERESEVFNCLVNTEDSIQMIAEKLYVSRRTLERHISAIYEKTGVKSRVGLLNLYNK